LVGLVTADVPARSASSGRSDVGIGLRRVVVARRRGSGPAGLWRRRQACRLARWLFGVAPSCFPDPGERVGGGCGRADDVAIVCVRTAEPNTPEVVARGQLAFLRCGRPRLGGDLLEFSLRGLLRFGFGLADSGLRLAVVTVPRPLAVLQRPDAPASRNANLHGTDRTARTYQTPTSPGRPFVAGEPGVPAVSCRGALVWPFGPPPGAARPLTCPEPD
jgi:hypothetical protein